MLDNPVYFVEAIQQFDFPTLMQNIGLGLLALFTPIAIFILDSRFEENYKDKENQEDKLQMNKLVILSQVFKPKIFAIGV